MSKKNLIEGIWGRVQTDYPELQIVQTLILDGDRFHGGTIELPTNEIEGIVIHFTDATHEMMAELMTHRKRSVELVAEMLGIDHGDVSTDMLKVFIFLHEAGHAYDYIKNFLVKEYAAKSTVPKTNATAAFAQRYNFEMNVLPVKNITPSQLKTALDLAQLLGNDSLDTLSDDPNIVQRAKDAPIELLREQEEAYKNGESEKQADAFAVAAMNQYGLIDR